MNGITAPPPLPLVEEWNVLKFKPVWLAPNLEFLFNLAQRTDVINS